MSLLCCAKENFRDRAATLGGNGVAELGVGAPAAKLWVNIARIVAHETYETYEKFNDLVVPILQERCRCKTEYTPGAFRLELFGNPPHPETHMPAPIAASRV